ncbi:MAG: hypothetical protein GY777_29775 [Candidatus Brocadiaceae bacterium]|nr:hypothetical protein [Candidatus Brocadiaceae bacterium]
MSRTGSRGSVNNNEASSNRIGKEVRVPNRTLQNRISLDTRPVHNRNRAEQNLKVYYTNSRSLGNKMDVLRTLVSTENIDIIAITETWINLDNKHFKTEYLIDGYNLYNTDRNSCSKGGGVAMYVRDSLKSSIKTGIRTIDSTETLWVEINNAQDSITMGVVYRPPNLNRESSKLIWDEVGRACRNRNVCIVGDFNYRNINWVEKTGNIEAEDFLEVVNDNFLFQHVIEPTRNENILDLVLSKAENMIHGIEIGGQLASSDHEEIRFGIKSSQNQIENVTSVPNFRQANYEGLRDYLKEVWEDSEGSGTELLGQEETGNISVEDGYNNFLDVVHRGQELNIPSRQYRSKRTDPRWLNNRLKHMIGKKKGVYRRIKRGEIQLRSQYTELNRLVKKEIRKAKRDYEIKIANDSKVNPKGFYQLYRTKARENIGPLKSEDGHITENVEEMCRILNAYFLSVFTEENLENIPAPEVIYRDSIENALDKVTISKVEIEKEIDRLKSQKAPGPDDIYARILKECKKEVSGKLGELFNNSLLTGEVPEAWKLANVVPIFKKGDRSISANYRPVSFTSTVGKLLESIIAMNIREHLEKYNLIRDSQHGFRKGYSCLTNLLSFFSEVYAALL